MMKYCLIIFFATLVSFMPEAIGAATYGEFSVEYRVEMLDACKIADFVESSLQSSDPAKGRLYISKTKVLYFSDVLNFLDSPVFQDIDLGISDTVSLKKFLTVIDNSKYAGEVFVLEHSEKELFLMNVGDRNFFCNDILNSGDTF